MPGKNIGGEDLDQVSQVGNVVHVGKGGGNESAFHGGDFKDFWGE